MAAHELHPIARKALAETQYPPREGEAVAWGEPLWDSAGYEHTLVLLGAGQAVTKQTSAFCVWDRRSGTSLMHGQDDLRLGNTPLPPEELARRRAEAAEVLDGLHAQARAVAKDGSGRRFFYNRFSIDVYSEDAPLAGDEDLGTIAELIAGECVGRVRCTEIRQISAREAAAGLTELEADPGFFGLTDDGSPLDPEGGCSERRG